MGNDISALFLQAAYYASLPAAGALFCVLVFMAGRRERGRLLLLSLAAALSLNTLLKMLFKVPRPWLMHAESAPFLAEGGYALPCTHTQLVSAVLCAFALTSRRRPVRLLCAAGICLTAAVRVWSGVQSFTDVSAGLAAGLLCAVLLCRFRYYAKSRTARMVSSAAVCLSGICAAVFFRDPWGPGLWLSAAVLLIFEKAFRKADAGRTFFGRLYGTVLAGGIYIGLYIFLPFLAEWFIPSLVPAQVLTVFLLTLLPCLLKFFPVF